MQNFINPEGLYVYRKYYARKIFDPEGSNLYSHLYFYKHLIPLESEIFNK